MTKYILVGGYDRKAPDGGKAFAEELIDGFDQPVRILVCLFARPKEEWDEVIEKDKLFFATMLRTKVLLELADEDRLIEQIERADAVYIRGGSEELLLISFLKQGQGVLEALKGKTIAGSSAGADAIAKYYYNLDNPGVEEGLGLLPIKVLVHYKSDYNAPNIDWDKAEAELVAHKEELPLVTLKEGEFTVMNG